MVHEELERLKEIELSILSEFDAFCRKHSLQYYLIGGALLGAARYGHLIPWDDDVDVAMPREDYERLYELWREDSPKGYFLQRAETDPFFARGITKIRKNGTEILEEISCNVKMHQGIYIDVFPIDYLEEADERFVAKRARKIRRCLSLRAIRSGYIGERKAFLKRIVRILLCPVPLVAFDCYLTRLSTEKNTEEHRYAILWTHNYDWRHQLHPISVFGEGSVCSLNGENVTAPVDTEAFLKKVFGENYMQEPPLDKQTLPHKYIEVKFEGEV